MTTSEARAERMAEVLREAGWEEGEGGGKLLRRMTYQAADGAQLRCDYFAGLTPQHGFAEELRVTRFDDVFHVDVTGSTDPPELPSTQPFDAILSVVAELTPRITASKWETHLGLILGMYAATVDQRGDRIGLGWRSALPTHLPWRAARPLGEVLPELGRALDDPDLLMETGYAALCEVRTNVAAVAFTRAEETGALGGMPALFLAWLRLYGDQDGAIEILDRARTYGDVTGPARWLQGSAERAGRGDHPAAIEAWRLGTVEDPAYFGCWSEYGLALAKNGDPAKAVEVLTEALAHVDHADVYERLGCAHVLGKNREAAIDAFEQAVRRRPAFAAKILEDPDYANLRQLPRFQALADLAAELMPGHHRTARARLLAEGTVVPAHPRAADTVFLRESMARTEYGRDIKAMPETDRAIVHDEALWTIVTEVGFPGHLGELNMDMDFDWTDGAPTALTLEARADIDGLFGLLTFGYSKRFMNIGADPETGAVFAADNWGGMWAVAPDLASYLLHLAAGAPLRLKLGKDDVHRLDTVDGSAPVAIEAEGLDQDGLDRVAAYVREHGGSLTELRVRRLSGVYTRVDLSDVDWAVTCPDLEVLELERVVVDGSVFAHPRLRGLTIAEGYVRGPRELAIGTGDEKSGDGPAADGRALERLEIIDCLVYADSFTAGPASRLTDFSYSLDEDYSEEYPELFTFDDCPALRRIYFHACMGWTLALRGSLPKLYRVDTNPGQYGGVDFSTAGTTAAETERYDRLIEEGREDWGDD